MPQYKLTHEQCLQIIEMKNMNAHGVIFHRVRLMIERRPFDIAETPFETSDVAELMPINMEHLYMCFYAFGSTKVLITGSNSSYSIPSGDLFLVYDASITNIQTHDIEEEHIQYHKQYAIERTGINPAIPEDLPSVEHIDRFGFVYFPIDELINSIGLNNTEEMEIFLTDDSRTYSNLRYSIRNWNADSKFGTLLATQTNSLPRFSSANKHSDSLAPTEGKPCPPFWKIPADAGVLIPFSEPANFKLVKTNLKVNYTNINAFLIT